jgi:glycosyltransferase involved in cell wall biosynthesis
MARAVARRGHAVSVYTTDREMDDAERPADSAPFARDGVTIRCFPQHTPRVIGASLPLMRALPQAIASADLVHLHSLYLFHVWATARECRRQDVPYLLRPHGTLDPFLWRRHRARKQVMEWLFQDRVIREAAAIHYTAEEEMRLAKPHVGDARAVVVPNGLDLADYRDLPPPGALRAKLPSVGTRRIVLFLSRLNFKKGLDVLIPGFAASLARAGDLHLVIAGPDDGELEATRALARAAGIADQVSFTGMLGHADKLAAFADSFMFVLPSYSENFGIAIVEAMACGLPVAISDRVNIWREIVDAGAGLAGPPTAEEVTRQIVTLAGDHARARTMGERGRALVERRFDWARVAEELESVYRSLAKPRTP